MPAQAIDQKETVLAYLRRKYWTALTETWNVAALQTLADTAYAAGTKTVTITGTSTEAGGSGSGEVTFDKLTLLAALEELLAEADPDNAPPVRARGFTPDFSLRNSST
jgi:hypothetical protein